MHAYVREDKRFERCEGYEGKNWDLLFMLAGLCHVGCARMAGQKYLIKIWFFGVWRGEARGFIFYPALLSLCGVSVLFIFLLFHCSCIQKTASIRGLLVMNWSRQLTHVNLLNTAMDNATYRLQHSTKGTNLI